MLDLSFVSIDESIDAGESQLEKQLMGHYSKFLESQYEIDHYSYTEKYITTHIIKGPREKLLKVIQSEKTSQKCKELALRLLVIFSSVFNSKEDLILVFNLSRVLDPTIDFTEELSLCKTNLEIFKDFENEHELRIEQEDSEHSSFDCDKFINHYELVNDQGELCDHTPHYPLVHDHSQLEGINLATADSAVFDEKYAYYVGKSFGLVKIGKEDSEGVQKGKLYCHEKKWAGVKFHIMCLRSFLYLQVSYTDEDYRSTTEVDKYSDYPFIILKTDDLKNPVNESFSSFNDEVKRKWESDDFKKPILENVNYKEINQEQIAQNMTEYRVVADIPLFTEGMLIYQVIYYVKSINGDSSGVERAVIEAYSPLNWKYVKEVDMKLEFEALDDVQLDSESNIKQRTGLRNYFIEANQAIVQSIRNKQVQ